MPTTVYQNFGCLWLSVLLFHIVELYLFCKAPLICYLPGNGAIRHKNADKSSQDISGTDIRTQWHKCTSTRKDEGHEGAETQLYNLCQRFRALENKYVIKEMKLVNFSNKLQQVKIKKIEKQ